MGSVLGKGQVDPQAPVGHYSSRRLLIESEGEVSRASFIFRQKLASDGYLCQNSLWLASSANNANDRYLIRQFDKQKVYAHKRVEATLRQLKIFTSIQNPYLSKLYFAFQDEKSLYMASEALDSFPLSTLLQYHVFSEEETRYVVMALLSIIQDVHSLGMALTQLSPQHIHIGINQGQLKLLQVPNPTPLNGHYSSNTVAQVCPYSAPEILCRDKVLAECDYYSLGMIMYEMMTQTPAYPGDLNDPEQTRNQLLKGIIEVEKSQIPQDWQTEAADFLIKLLIKNPALRLGRYGAFQVMNHPWLKGYSSEDNRRGRIRLTHQQFQSIPAFKVEQKGEPLPSTELVLSHFFQMQFSEYSYTRPDCQQGQGQSLLEEPIVELSQDKTSMFENESNLKLRHGL